MSSSSTPLEDQMLVLPSRRAITFFKAALAKRSEKPVFLPRLLTMDELARDISGWSLMDQVSTALELYDCYREIFTEAEPYEKFEAWTGAILRDFNAIDTYLIDPKKVYRDLRLLKEINEWSFASEELLGDQVEFNEFWQRLGHLYEQFNERLSAQGRSYSGGILREAASKVGEQKIYPKIAQITIAGFNALSPAEIKLLDQFHVEGRLSVHWDSAPFYTENAADPAGLFMRRWAKKDWNQTFGKASEKKAEVSIASHPHAISQVLWAGNLLANSDTSPKSIALVLADEKLITPLLDYFPKNLEHVNITIGLSFKETIVFKFFCSYFNMHVAAQRAIVGQGSWALHHHEFRRWMEMASHFGIVDDALVKRVERMVVDERRIFFSEKDLVEILSKEKAERFAIHASDRESILSASLNLLADIQTKDKLMMGVATRLSELLSEAAVVITRYTFVDSIEAMWKCLKGGLARERISFVGEPLQGLQVMGLLETRALDFDEVVLLGANEGTLPKAQRFDSFLPYDLRMHYGLPTQKEEDAVFAYYFYRLIQSSNKTSIAFTSERDELGGGEQSRYIAQLIAGLPQSAGFDIDLKSQAYIPSVNEVPVPWVTIPKTDEVTASVLHWYQNRGVSFSRLSEFGKCPLDFYYRTVLGLGESSEVEEELGASDLGDIVHKVLEDSFAEMIGKGALVKKDIDEMAAKYPAILEKVLLEKGLNEISMVGESALVKAVAVHMLKNFFEREGYRVSESRVEVKSLEQRWELTLDVPIAGRKVPVLFKATMDRVEQGDQGELLVDFKTGRVAAADVALKILDKASLFDPKKSKVFQLLYYTWFYWRFTGGSIATSGIISLIGMEERPLTLLLESQPLPTEEQLTLFEDLLFEYLEEIAIIGEFTHDTEEGYYCNYCIEKAERKW